LSRTLCAGVDGSAAAAVVGENRRPGGVVDANRPPHAVAARAAIGVAGIAGAVGRGSTQPICAARAARARIRRVNAVAARRAGGGARDNQVWRRHARQSGLGRQRVLLAAEARAARIAVVGAIAGDGQSHRRAAGCAARLLAGLKAANGPIGAALALAAHAVTKGAAAAADQGEENQNLSGHAFAHSSASGQESAKGKQGNWRLTSRRIYAVFKSWKVIARSRCS
jgi:hypothetical protein